MLYFKTLFRLYLEFHLFYKSQVSLLFAYPFPPTRYIRKSSKLNVFIYNMCAHLCDCL